MVVNIQLPEGDPHEGEPASIPLRTAPTKVSVQLPKGYNNENEPTPPQQDPYDGKPVTVTRRISYEGEPAATPGLPL